MRGRIKVESDAICASLLGSNIYQNVDYVAMFSEFWKLKDLFWKCKNFGNIEYSRINFLPPAIFVCLLIYWIYSYEYVLKQNTCLHFSHSQFIWTQTKNKTGTGRTGSIVFWAFL